MSIEFINSILTCGGEQSMALDAYTRLKTSTPATAGATVGRRCGYGTRERPRFSG
jgi:hypothetical protein